MLIYKRNVEHPGQCPNRIHVIQRTLGAFRLQRDHKTPVVRGGMDFCIGNGQKMSPYRLHLFGTGVDDNSGYMNFLWHRLLSEG